MFFYVFYSLHFFIANLFLGLCFFNFLFHKIELKLKLKPFIFLYFVATVLTGFFLKNIYKNHLLEYSILIKENFIYRMEINLLFLILNLFFLYKNKHFLLFLGAFSTFLYPTIINTFFQNGVLNYALFFYKISHVFLASLIVASIFIINFSKNLSELKMNNIYKTAALIGLISCFSILIISHSHIKNIATFQQEKFAKMEAKWENNNDFVIIANVNEAKKANEFELKLPILNYLIKGIKIKTIKEFENQENVLIAFLALRIMVFLNLLIMIFFFFILRNRNFLNKLMQHFSYIATFSGTILAEIANLKTINPTINEILVFFFILLIIYFINRKIYENFFF